MAKIVVPKLDLKKCTRCGACIENCPESALHIDQDRVVQIIAERCTYCGVCETICPEQAVSLPYIISWS